MAEAQLRVGVDVAQDKLTLGSALAAFVNGLTAAADAAAGAGHNLHEVVVHLAVFDGVAQIVGVLQAAYDGNGKLFAGQIVGNLAPAFATAYGAEGVGIGIFARYQEVCAAQGSFHNAAGGTEDMPRARGFTQGHVELFFGQALHVHELGLQHAAELTRGKNHVNIGAGAGGVHVGVGAFGLLCNARHDGNHGNLRWVNTQDLGIVVLGNGTENLLGRFRGGKVLYQAGVLRLQEAYPAGAA